MNELKIINFFSSEEVQKQTKLEISLKIKEGYDLLLNQIELQSKERG